MRLAPAPHLPLVVLLLGALPAWAAPGITVHDTVVGTGDLVEPGCLVSLHYIARTDDGTLVDTTYLRGEPRDIRQGTHQVPDGWDEALLGMHKGGARVVDVPAALGFGDHPPEGVPAGTGLHIEMWAMDVGPPRKPPAPPSVPSTAWSRTATGARLARLAAGSGRPAEVGDDVTVEITAWNSDGDVLDSSYLRPGPDTFQPGSGKNHPDLEAALVGSRPGDRLLVELSLAKGQPPVRILLEVQDTASSRRPPKAPAAVDAYISTASGLRYADLQPGTGPAAATGDTVVVEYTGWLDDGTMFDSSLSRQAPFTLVLGAGEVIDGWDEGLQGMQVGGTRQLVIPSKLGYGDRGSPPTIPPGATLIFQVTLVRIL